MIPMIYCLQRQTCLYPDFKQMLNTVEALCYSFFYIL